MKIKKIALLLLVMATIFGCSITSPFIVKAGKSTVGVIQSESLLGKIDSGTWINSGKVQGENDKMVFDSRCSQTAKLTAMTKIVDVSRYGVDKIFQCSFTVNIENIPSESGNRFAFAFGLSKVSSKLGSDGVVEVYFTKNTDGLKLGVCRYYLSEADSGIHKNDYVVPTTFAGMSIGIDLHFSVMLDCDGVLYVDVLPDGADEEDKMVVCKETTPNNTNNTREGFVCFGQNGKCDATVFNVVVSSYDYDNMETPLRIEENFDNGHYNSNAWFSKSDAGKYPGGISVSDGALKFYNAQNAIFGTKYAYSNFEMTFDIIDIRRENGLDDNGNLIAPISSWFGIALATPAYNSSFGASVTGEFFMDLEYSGRTVAYRNYKPSVSPWNSKFTENFWKKENAGEIYNFKVSMIDGVYTLNFKNKMQDKFPSEPFFSMDLGYTPHGCVRLLAYEPAGFVFDNFVIENKDAEPIAKDLTYSANALPGMEDYPYVETWSDEDLIENRISYNNKVEETSEGCNGRVSSSIEFSLVLLIATLFVIVEKRRERS